MTIIVTGGCGFIGSHLVEHLADAGEKVLVIDDCRAEQTYKVPGVEYYKDSIAGFYATNIVKEKLAELKITEIFHFAATPRIALSFTFPEHVLTNNYISTVKVAMLAKYCKAKLWFASSSTVPIMDKTNNPYTFSKSVSEDMLTMMSTLYNLDTTIMRFYSVYGSRETDYGLYSTLIRACKNSLRDDKPIFLYGDGKQKRDFTHVDDLIAGIMACRSVNFKGLFAEFGAGKAVSIIDIIKAFGVKYKKVDKRLNDIDHTECSLSWQFMPEECKSVFEYIKEYRDAG